MMQRVEEAHESTIVFRRPGGLCGGPFGEVSCFAVVGKEPFPHGHQASSAQID